MHNFAYYPLLCLGGMHQIDTAHVAVAAAIILIFALAFMAVTRTKKPKKEQYKRGGEIVVNRNDPARDYIRWELMSWPDDWTDGDQLIFTVVEHKVVQSGPEVEVKK